MEIFNGFTELLAHPTSLFFLLGVFLILISFVYIKKIKFTPKVISKIGIMLALMFILHTIKLYHMPQGGSVTLGAMVPLVLVAFCYGPFVGALTGFLYGFINLITDPFILNPVQVLFDYPLPFMAFFVVGLFPKNIIFGTILAMTLRFLCHFISGVAFFASYAPEGVSPYFYSFMFNISYLLPELIITLIIIKLLPKKQIFTALAAK